MRGKCWQFRREKSSVRRVSQISLWLRWLSSREHQADRTLAVQQILGLLFRAAIFPIQIPNRLLPSIFMPGAATACRLDAGEPLPAYNPLIERFGIIQAYASLSPRNRCIFGILFRKRP